MAKKGQTVDPYVKCPYYRKQEACRICCEGFAEGVYPNMVFLSDAARKHYETVYCKGEWGKCQIAQCHNRIWGY